jgi:hypothetical protein
VLREHGTGHALVCGADVGPAVEWLTGRPVPAGGALLRPAERI